MQAVLVIVCLMLLFDGVAFLVMPERIKAWLDEVSPTELRIVGILEAAIAVSALLVAFLR